MTDNDKIVIATVNGLKLVQLCDKDFNDLMQYLVEHFTPNEPTSRSINITSNDEWEMTGAAIRRCLKLPYSYALKNENDEIVATRIADVIERPKLNDTGKNEASNEQCGNQPKKMTVSATEMNRLINALESKIWQLMPLSTTKLLKILIVSTHEKYTRRGLMHKLMTFDMTEQKRDGIQGGISKAIAQNSQRLFAKLGYQVIYQINYDEWLDKDGKQIFNCDDGTNCAQLVYKSY
ncbi:Epsin-1 [Dirofilaria immitis]